MNQFTSDNLSPLDYSKIIVAPRKNPLHSLFAGKKEKWLPLYQRLIARFSRIPGMDPKISTGHVTFGSHGTIRVKANGLELGLALSKKALIKSPRLKTSLASPRKITHRILIATPKDIDEELISWVKAAQVQERTSKHRSI